MNYQHNGGKIYKKINGVITLNPLYIALTCIAAISVIIPGTSLVCFFIIFYSPRRKENKNGRIEIPADEIYQVHRELIESWVISARTSPHKDVEIKSYDGLTLKGKFYEYAPKAVIEIMFHGYHGNSERDMSGGIVRASALGHSALVVDQRGAGHSDGKVVTFGVREYRDVLSWIDFVIKEIDPDAKIILTGISMGASTVLIASGQALPKNIVGILADCGYTFAKAIIKKVIGVMKLPPNVMYPFVKLGARIFGGFDLDEISPIEAVKNSKIPTIFFHGDTDSFVPCYMSEENFKACRAPKKLVLIKGAGHGLAFPANQELYIKEAKDFFDTNITVK